MLYTEKLLIMAGGKISCHRCQALSKRTKQQCGRPSLKGKQVCDFHGGKSTGPRTAEGKERSRQAHIKSGLYTKESRLRESGTSLTLAQLEDMMLDFPRFSRQLIMSEITKRKLNERHQIYRRV